MSECMVVVCFNHCNLLQTPLLPKTGVTLKDLMLSQLIGLSTSIMMSTGNLKGSFRP